MCFKAFNISYFRNFFQRKNLAKNLQEAFANIFEGIGFMVGQQRLWRKK
jgi:hypothetical protein